MPTDGQWREHYLRLNVRQHSGQFRLNLDLHTISCQNRVEKCNCMFPVNTYGPDLWL